MKIFIRIAKKEKCSLCWRFHKFSFIILQHYPSDIRNVTKYLRFFFISWKMNFFNQKYKKIFTLNFQCEKHKNSRNLKNYQIIVQQTFLTSNCCVSYLKTYESKETFYNRNFHNPNRVTDNKIAMAWSESVNWE